MSLTIKQYLKTLEVAEILASDSTRIVTAKSSAVKKTTKVKKPEVKKPATKKKPSMDTVRKNLDAKLFWWNNLSHDEQKSYLDEHPKSKLPLKKSVAPKSIKDKAKSDGKKTSKNAKEDKEQDSGSKELSEKIKISPITEDEKTTELFKVDRKQINKVPEAQQQEIHAKVLKAFDSDEKENEDEEDIDEKEDNNEDEKESDDDKEDADTDDELSNKVLDQLHPKQKIGFIKAAKTIISKHASKEDKEAAFNSMSHLAALQTLTKIAGAASVVALTYYFGSAPAAQTAIMFALHHGEHVVRESSAKDFIKKWAHKRFTGDSKDPNEDANMLLGISEYVAKHKSKNNSSKPSTSHNKPHK
jgi:hypothetical protein